MMDVTIVIPVRNEESFIHKSLTSILNQSQSGLSMEVLVVDGMSDDNSRQIIRDLADQYPEIPLRILDNVNRIVPTGMNIALRESQGRIIIRVDGHTAIEPDYVCQCVETLQRTNADNVGGKMNAIGNNSFGRAVALATSTLFGVGGGRFHYSDKEEWVDTVYMGAWPRQVFKKIGLFDEELVRDQDDEFNYRLRAAGGKILLSPKIKSEYAARSSTSALWRQYFQYGFWKVRVLQKHPRQMSLRQFVPPVFVFSLLVSAFLFLFPVFRILSIVVPLCYFPANILASLYTASKRGWAYLPLLPITFAILHVSYGLGFLTGLFKFWNRWGDKQGKVPLL